MGEEGGRGEGGRVTERERNRERREESREVMGGRGWLMKGREGRNGRREGE